MDNLRELYQQMILDHNQNPQNFRSMENANRTAEGFNPLCGDQLMIYADVNNDVIQDISFLGSGCAISKAATSIMTTTLKGKTIAETNDLFDAYHKMVTSGSNNGQDMGKLSVMEGVHKYPSRVKCAILCWYTLKNALEEKHKTAVTE